MIAAVFSIAITPPNFKAFPTNFPLALSLKPRLLEDAGDRLVQALVEIGLYHCAQHGKEPFPPNFGQSCKRSQTYNSKTTPVEPMSDLKVFFQITDLIALLSIHNHRFGPRLATFSCCGIDFWQPVCNARHSCSRRSRGRLCSRSWSP